MISIALGIVAIVYVFSHTLTSTIGGHVMTVFYCITSIGIIVGIYSLVRFRRLQDWLSFIATLCLVAAFFNSGYNISHFVNYWIGIGFTYSCCFLLGVLVFQMRSENKEKESYWIASSKLSAQKERLELELLKNSIQPHFLMNTLTSVMEWVEESPKKGIQFIDTLAGEFRHLYEISDNALIPIEKEPEVCRTFLSIMHYRKEVFYQLDTEGINSSDQVTPLVFTNL